jgi:hypothetical protein
MFDLLLIAYRCVDLRADHAADVDGCCANPSTCRMNQDTLQKLLVSSIDPLELLLDLPARLRVVQARASRARRSRRHRAW